MSIDTIQLLLFLARDHSVETVFNFQFAQRLLETHAMNVFAHLRAAGKG